MVARKRMRLTEAAIAGLRACAREYTVWDSRVPGLGVRVRSNGGASYILLRKVDGRSRRIGLGPVTSLNVESARRRCNALLAGAESESAQKTTCSVPLFRDFVIEQWKAVHYPWYKPSTRKRASGYLTRQLLPAFGSTPLNGITSGQVVRWFGRYSQSAPGGANTALRILRAILNFAIACGHIETNPTLGVQSNRRKARNRFLSREEIRRLHRVLDEQSRKGPAARQEADIVRLLLLTGCRLGEVLQLRWCEVDSDMLVLADSKTGPRKVHLNAQARHIIDDQLPGRSAYVFPSPRGFDRPRSPTLPSWNSIRRYAGIEDVRIHDLRHSFASHAVMSGIPVPVVSRLLGHSNVRMTLRYSHLDQKDIEAAAERVGTALAQILAIR